MLSYQMWRAARLVDHLVSVVLAPQGPMWPVRSHRRRDCLGRVDHPAVHHGLPRSLDDHGAASRSVVGGDRPVEVELLAGVAGVERLCLAYGRNNSDLRWLAEAGDDTM